MVEVFKTDVSRCDDAQRLIEQIHLKFTDYKANFDLEDCDLILRVQSLNSSIIPEAIISILEQNGFYAEILEDDFQPSVSIFSSLPS
ncbi:hypothetical protein EZ428_09465 [Pedobacter frigiditerrae]|uniref:HMA domain-containing protein n=2 Tax=Pedobacter frigiditerrae TaxID=2530452 RepID=A0A4R0MZM2_9SPHI|nr:hypothetical protein EZ428_09465 [Pedobacter frigiditerrae]